MLNPKTSIEGHIRETTAQSVALLTYIRCHRSCDPSCETSECSGGDPCTRAGPSTLAAPCGGWRLSEPGPSAPPCSSEEPLPTEPSKWWSLEKSENIFSELRSHRARFVTPGRAAVPVGSMLFWWMRCWRLSTGFVWLQQVCPREVHLPHSLLVLRPQ